ncbi:hypothetical protein GCM10009837_60980 [Streptomyces durmitorensis]|uniref:DUF333 domain-containing protein n=1 Tax=Streptomyces durmitorensis TaxID=319947 RepID=A0ABY4Q3M7_9ACTN|nr:hypothetical protein [Streptomyces durmitorensis]UQT59980.1 hypothetical protein M4V62_35725 [Streptomyces durmitorensis]
MKRSQVLSLGAALLLSGSAVAANAADSPAAPAAGPAAKRVPADATWCKKQGGTAQKQVPYYTKTGTQIVRLGGEREMCVFTGADGTKITIGADSLAADKPTLAALAYVHKPADPGGHPGNPSLGYCKSINGTALYGPKSTDGGGWAKKGETNPSNVVSSCMFADGSVIDAWGLKYHSGDVIRGADLTKKFRADIP